MYKRNRDKIEFFLANRDEKKNVKFEDFVLKKEIGKVNLPVEEIGDKNAAGDLIILVVLFFN